MQGFLWALSSRSIKLHGELRLYATCRILEFSFSPGHVPEHGVQPLWSQYQEAEQEHEQDFRSKTHDSPLGYGSVAGNGGWGGGWLLVLGFHR